MKKVLLACVILLFVINLVGCNNKGSENEEKPRAVTVMQVKNEENPVYLSYLGTVQADNIIEYSVKSAGRIEKIFVEKGMEVKKGDLLVELDKKDLENTMNIAKAQMNAAKSQYDKLLNGATLETINRLEADVDTAKSSFEYAKELYAKMQKLYENGAISKQKLDDTKLQYDSSRNAYYKAKEALAETVKGAREEDIEAARAQYEAAQKQYEINLELYNDATVYAKQDGVVVDVLYEETELVPQGYPILMVRSNQQIVSIGISQNDIDDIQLGTEAIINIDGKEANGYITYISEVPDETTRTYDAEITIEDEMEYKLGAIADVKLYIGKEKGIWIPLRAILSDGEDYVYIIKDERSYKNIVEITQVYNNKAKVKNLNPGDTIVIEGMKYLVDGKKVVIVE